MITIRKKIPITFEICYSNQTILVDDMENIEEILNNVTETPNGIGGNILIDTYVLPEKIKEEQDRLLRKFPTINGIKPSIGHYLDN